MRDNLFCIAEYPVAAGLQSLCLNT